MSEGVIQDRYRRCSDVRFRIVDGEAVILRQSAAENIVLNEVGSSILQWIDAGHSVSEILEKLPKEYDVPADQVIDDVPGFLRELEQAGIVEPIESSDHPTASPPG